MTTPFPRITPRRRRLLDRLLDGLLDLDDNARERELAAIAGRTARIHRWLVALLAASAEQPGEDLSTLFERVGQAAQKDAVSRHEVTLAPDTRVGAWRIEHAVGHGGMGTVYKARRADGAFEMEAAVKVIRVRRAALEERLTMERQLLARLSHRGIARLIDGGSTGDGHAFLVMEWVPGRDLDAYVHDEAPALGRRLDLFEQMASAASHAHQRRVVHGDLKPSNVRVNDEGAVRLVDFGIARLLEEGEASGESPLRALTPEFAAPELRAGESPSTQSDVWSLGAMLYWLLTDSLLQSRAGPIHGESLQRSIPRRDDLAAIVARATAEDPRDRYPTVFGLIEDIRRYRTRMPVEARAPTRLYLVKRFVDRHRFAVGMAGAVSAALCLALAGALWQAHRATVERDRAAAQTERALMAEAESTQLAGELEQVVAFQAAQLSAIDVRRMGVGLRTGIAARHRESMARNGMTGPALQERDLEAQRMLARVNFSDLARDALQDNIFENALESIDDQFADQPLLRARLLQTVATTQRAVGLERQAGAPQREALAVRREMLGDQHPDTLESVNRMGQQLMAEGSHDEALAQYRKALAGLEALHGPKHPETLTALSNAGIALEAMGRYVDAEPNFREALQGRREVLGPEHPDTLVSMSNMAALFDGLERPAEALPLYREALGTRRAVLGDDHPDTLRSISNLGVFLAGEDRFDEAEPYYREALAGRTEVLGREHPETLVSTNNMGYLLVNTDRLVEAEHHFQQALSMSRRVRGDQHPLTLVAMNNLADLLHKLGRYEDAEALAAEAVSGGRQSLEDGHWYLGVFLNRQGRELAALGRFDEAEAVMLESHGIFVEAFGAEHGHTQVVVKSLADVYASWHEVAPGAGHDEHASAWRARLINEE
ncbi:serine/threonine-protein kinase [Wenzhouxiangella sediminis]|uniref:serine/threonine-protein kinase n=1 Tax=Wenzhouxiangella sediminis TaxID=1792836 RepID=UPI0011C07F8F|nr:serine/threonine-protein kinase [Wenzhouxiangella sediminis]